MGKHKDSYQIPIGFVGYESRYEVLVRQVCEKFGRRLHCFQAYPQSQASERESTVHVLIVDQDSIFGTPMLQEWRRKLGTLQPEVLIVLGGQDTGDWLSNPVPSCVEQFIILGEKSTGLEPALARVLKAHSNIPSIEDQSE